jgi:cytoskeletal protein CcmA (bactofilin family)
MTTNKSVWVNLMTKKIIQVNKNPVYEIGMISTVFNKNTEFYGDLSFKKSLQINGKFEGEITSGNFLVIGEEAFVKANIRQT